MLLARLCNSLIQDGALTIIDADGRSHRFGQASRPAEIVARLHDRSLHIRLAASPCLALGEAYVAGTLTMERGSIFDLLDLCARNAARLDAHPVKRALDRSASLLQRYRSRPDVAPQEPFADAFYDRFLDWDRQHSCAYFADPRMTLEEAQQAKKHHLASKLLLRPGQRVLDIGSGWGGIALHLADAEHVDVTGITLSAEHLAVARRRALEAELTRRVRFHLRSFREEAGRYDRVLSVGVLEQIGPREYGEFFSKIHDLMAPDGVAVVHAIMRREGPAATNGWLRRHVLPGAYVPALSEVLPAVERAGLWIADVEVLRLHAAETVRCWRRRFEDSKPRVTTPEEARAHRRLEFYFALAESGFRSGGMMACEIQLARSPDAVPVTRDYLYDRADDPETTVEMAA